MKSFSEPPKKSHLIGLYLILAMILAAILLLTAVIWMLFRQPTEPVEEPASFCYQLGVYQDRLAVYTNNQRHPAEILDIPVAALPEEDQRLLQEGILLPTEEALRQAIEDFT